jgi:hypothetical protein
MSACAVITSSIDKVGKARSAYFPGRVRSVGLDSGGDPASVLPATLREECDPVPESGTFSEQVPFKSSCRPLIDKREGP